MKKLLLVRHAESIKNLEDRFGDPATRFRLTGRGVKKAERVAAVLRTSLRRYSREHLAILSPPEQRALCTGEILAKELGVRLTIRRALRPIDAGDVRGMTEVEAASRHPELMRQTELYRGGDLSAFSIRYPNGEDVRGFQRRVRRSLERFLAATPARVGILVAHRSTITAILSSARASLEKRDFYYYFDLRLCGVSEVRWRTGGPMSIVYVDKDVAGCS